MNKKSSKLVLPALRGFMGDWVYYCCLFDLRELSARVDYAREIHTNDRLSDMIQRHLEKGRSALISKYLCTQRERFFNSLVVATYDGKPNWHALSSVQSKANGDELKDLSEMTIASVGFLTLNGDEKLFALDGQHRLAGIKKAIASEFSHVFDEEEVSVILVAHRDTCDGLERTRRLFTTLNKNAKPVSKGDIIALDEDDVMAICVRRLIEETSLFRGDRVAFVANNNMPKGNTSSLTTIGNLYDVLTTLFTVVESPLKKRIRNLKTLRPDDRELDDYFQFSKDFFDQLSTNLDELKEFFDATSTTEVVRRYRGIHGGSVLFRPIGLWIFVRVIAHLTKTMPLADAIELAGRLPRELNKVPYKGLVWDDTTRKILNSSSHKVTLREILLYMVGQPEKSGEDLRKRYRKDLGDETVELPAIVS